MGIQHIKLFAFLISASHFHIIHKKIKIAHTREKERAGVLVEKYFVNAHAERTLQWDTSTISCLTETGTFARGTAVQWSAPLISFED